jgi:carbon monoxide dehydrogenase subunit G
MNHSGTFSTTRRPEDVFELLADPLRFAPLLPDFETIVVQDATHFTLRIRITVAQIDGHANLAMELGEVVRPSRVDYRGQGTVAGSQLKLNLQFRIAPSLDATEVNWQGEFSLDGMLALMAGHLIEPMGRRTFELMAERLQNGLRDNAYGDLLPVPPSASDPPDPDNQS